MRRHTVRSSRSSLVIGIDLGGTNMQIGVVDARNRIIGRDRRKTQARDGCDRVIERIVEGIHAACGDAKTTIKQVAAIGIAAPGAIDIPRGVVLEAPNLGWYDVPLRDLLRKYVRCPVVVDNDVNGAVWGEYKLGAGRAVAKTDRANDSRDVLGVWLGTGVGGGLVIDGKLFHGDFFTAGEVGQTVLFPHGEKRRRIVEDFCSRTGMSRTIRERLSKHRKSILREWIDSPNAVIPSSQLARAYRKKDSLAREVVHESADLLGIAIANWVTVLSVDTVIIGGGVAEALGPAFLKRVRKSFRRDVFPKRCRAAKLIMTQLEDDAGLLGAALLARETLQR